MNLSERVRYLRHHLLMVWPLYKLSTGDYRTGLGPSAWLLHGLVRSLAPDVVVETGSFGANMQVSLINDGPVTFLLESG